MIDDLDIPVYVVLPGGEEVLYGRSAASAAVEEVVTAPATAPADRRLEVLEGLLHQIRERRRARP